MRSRSLLLAVALLLAATPVAVAAAEDARGAEGVWVTADGDGWIEIHSGGAELYGVILGGPKDDDRLDDKNPDPELRHRRLTGLRILDGFTPETDTKWTGGTIYDPNNGKTYSCILELEDADTLKVRGFIGVSLFGRTERWTRKKDK